MSRKENQKGKLLALARLLERDSDEKHRLTVPEMIDRLAEQGIPSERKSVYADLDTLREMG